MERSYPEASLLKISSGRGAIKLARRLSGKTSIWHGSRWVGGIGGRGRWQLDDKLMGLKKTRFVLKFLDKTFPGSWVWTCSLASVVGVRVSLMVSKKHVTPWTRFYRFWVSEWLLNDATSTWMGYIGVRSALFSCSSAPFAPDIVLVSLTQLCHGPDMVCAPA